MLSGNFQKKTSKDGQSVRGRAFSENVVQCSKAGEHRKYSLVLGTALADSVKEEENSDEDNKATTEQQQAKREKTSNFAVTSENAGSVH